MNRLPPLALTAAASILGAVLTLIIALGALESNEVEHLVIGLVFAILLTVGATWALNRKLEGSSLAARFSSVAAIAALVGLVNLAVLAKLMIVSHHDAAQVLVLLAYSAAAGLGSALAVSRTSTAAVERLSDSARRIAGGDLSARAGSVGGGRELDELAGALDEMAERLDASLTRERTIEGQRRDLVVAVSHDLRTPLAGLRAMAEAIDDRVVEDPETLHRYVGKMRDSVGSLVGLIDDLFEIVQLDAGAIEAETERAKVADVVRSALAACDAQATEKGLVLQTSLGDAGTATCSPRLTRVIQNLLQNAIRHTPSDGTVLVEARQYELGIELAVEDSGEGIEPAVADRVFEPFWRGDEARSGDGAGLGLALAKRIVEALGGSIRLEPAGATGSRFAIVLPTAEGLS